LKTTLTRKTEYKMKGSDEQCMLFVRWPRQILRSSGFVLTFLLHFLRQGKKWKNKNGLLKREAVS